MQTERWRQYVDSSRSKVKLLYVSGRHCYLHWVVMDSICWQRLHQGQIPSEKEEQVNRYSTPNTSSLSPGGGWTTDRVGFKLQSLSGRSHFQWQADRFVARPWQNEGRVHWSVQGHKSSEGKWPRVALIYTPWKNPVEDCCHPQGCIVEERFL